MGANFTIILTLSTSAFTLFTSLLKLRQEADERRDIALGINGEGLEISKSFRLHILRKDVLERCIAMVLLLFSFGIVAIGAAGYILLNNKYHIDVYLALIILLFGLSCLIGGIFTWKLGNTDYKQYKQCIESEKWHGDDLITKQLAAPCKDLPNA